MKRISLRKYCLPFALIAGLTTMIMAPASQAGWWYRHHWHPQGRVVHFRGCKKIVIQRYCRINRWGVRHCYRVRRVHWVC